MNIPTHNFMRRILKTDSDGNIVMAWALATESIWLASGIKDANGQEIFEGDIVLFKDGKTYPVIFADAMFTVNDAPLKLLKGECVIIGHVEDNQ